MGGLRLSGMVRGLFAAAALAFAAISPAAAAEPASPLVSVGWLTAHLSDPDLVVLDIRSAIDGGGAEAYAQGHIPGAIHSDYDKGGWRVTRDNVPFMLPTLAELEKLIGETGIDEDSRVVVVPAGVNVLDFGSAARIYWTLKVAGLTRVSILDGGVAAWKAAGNQMQTGVNAPTPKIFTATLDKSLLADAGDVEKIEKSGGATLFDARPPEFYAGKDKYPTAKLYGHIPGAISLDSERFYDDASNRLKPKTELAAIAATLPEGPAVSYCNTGHWAATDWFVLSEVLGRKNVRLYSGSMVDWSSNPNRPVESSRTKWDDLKKRLGFGT